MDDNVFSGEQMTRVLRDQIEKNVVSFQKSGCVVSVRKSIPNDGWSGIVGQISYESPNFSDRYARFLGWRANLEWETHPEYGTRKARWLSRPCSGRDEFYSSFSAAVNSASQNWMRNFAENVCRAWNLAIRAPEKWDGVYEFVASKRNSAGRRSVKIAVDSVHGSDNQSLFWGGVSGEKVSENEFLDRVVEFSR